MPLTMKLHAVALSGQRRPAQGGQKTSLVPRVPQSCEDSHALCRRHPATWPHIKLAVILLYGCIRCAVCAGRGCVVNGINAASGEGGVAGLGHVNDVSGTGAPVLETQAT